MKYVTVVKGVVSKLERFEGEDIDIAVPVTLWKCNTCRKIYITEEKALACSEVH